MVKINTDPSELMICLEELDAWLSQRHIKLDLAVIGSFAFYLLGMRGIITRDIDTTVHLQDEVLEQVKKIGLEHGMGNEWLNDNASTLSLPSGFDSRLTVYPVGKHLTLWVASRYDLILLKSAAYVGRGNEDPRDLEQLRQLKPTLQEIEEAIKFVRGVASPPAKRFYPNFEEMLEDLRSVTI